MGEYSLSIETIVKTSHRSCNLILTSSNNLFWINLSLELAEIYPPFYIVTLKEAGIPCFSFFKFLLYMAVDFRSRRSGNPRACRRASSALEGSRLRGLPSPVLPQESELIRSHKQGKKQQYRFTEPFEKMAQTRTPAFFLVVSSIGGTLVGCVGPCLCFHILLISQLS